MGASGRVENYLKKLFNSTLFKKEKGLILVVR